MSFAACNMRTNILITYNSLLPMINVPNKQSTPVRTLTSCLCKQVFKSTLIHSHVSCFVNMNVFTALLATSVLLLAATLAQHEFMYDMTDINFIPIHISNFDTKYVSECVCVCRPTVSYLPPAAGVDCFTMNSDDFLL